MLTRRWIDNLTRGVLSTAKKTEPPLAWRAKPVEEELTESVSAEEVLRQLPTINIGNKKGARDAYAMLNTEGAIRMLGHGKTLVVLCSLPVYNDLLTASTEEPAPHLLIDPDAGRWSYRGMLATHEFSRTTAVWFYGTHAVGVGMPERVFGELLALSPEGANRVMNRSCHRSIRELLERIRRNR